MVTPSWILFDVGVVLLDWPASSHDVAKRLKVPDEVLFSELKKIAYKMNIGEISPIEGWAIILNNLGSEVSAIEIIKSWSSPSYWHNDSLKLLKELSRNTNIALLTNSWLGLRQSIANNELPAELKLVKRIFDSSEIGLVKPDPAIYKFVEHDLDVPVSEIFLIDDDERNVKVALERGWQSYHYYMGPDKGKKSNNELRQLLNKK